MGSLEFSTLSRGDDDENSQVCAPWLSWVRTARGLLRCYCVRARELRGIRFCTVVLQCFYLILFSFIFVYFIFVNFLFILFSLIFYLSFFYLSYFFIYLIFLFILFFIYLIFIYFILDFTAAGKAAMACVCFTHVGRCLPDFVRVMLNVYFINDLRF